MSGEGKKQAWQSLTQSFASGARWVGCKPYKEEHTLRFPPPLHHMKRRSAPYSLSHPSLRPSAKLESYHLNVTMVVVGQAEPTPPAPFCLNTLAARLPDSNISTRTLSYPVTVRPTKGNSAPIWGFPQLWNASLLHRTREPRTNVILREALTTKNREQNK